MSDERPCDCGHRWIDHHGVDPRDGCMGVISHREPQCPCDLTAGEAREVALNDPMFDFEATP